MKSKQKSILKSLYAAIIQSRISFFCFFFASFLVCSVEKARSPEDAILYCVTGSSLCVFVGSVKKNKQKLKPTIVQLAGRSPRAAVVWGSGGGRFKPLALFPCVLLSIGEEGGRGAEGKFLAKE